MADFGSSEAGRRGGEARAKKLTRGQRQEQARLAAAVRWKKPLATHEGEIELEGGISVACAVLEDGTRVLSQRGLSKAMGASKPMGRSRRGAGKLPAILSAASLKPFISNDLEATANPIEYLPLQGGRTALGMRAEALPKILRVWADADDAGALRHNQRHLGIKAKILLKALAGVGVVALVDEATGFQDDRARDDLVKVLRAFVAKELQAWISTFEMDFYRLICQVRGEPLSRAYSRPAYFGHLTNEIVYRRLAPGVLDELRRKNPVQESGRRKHKHHQHLTRDIGHPKLREHLAGVTTALRIVTAQHGDWNAFMDVLNRTHPPYIDMPLFNQSDEEAADD